MKRLALVTPLYGKEATGSTAAYARRLAELLTHHYQVDVLTMQNPGKTGMSEPWRPYRAFESAAFL